MKLTAHSASLAISGLCFGCSSPSTTNSKSAESPAAATSMARSDLPRAPGRRGVPRPGGKPRNLAVLDWAGFTGAVSYTFDDANSSQLAHYEELQARAVPMTFYLITSKPEASDPIWARAVRDGHELGNHTHNHRDNDTGADTDAASAFLLERFGVTAWTMAAPFGAGVYTELAKSRFLINRGVSSSLVAANDASDPFRLPCWVPPEGAPASAFDAQIDAARAARGWHVALVHGFSGGSDGAYLPVAAGEFLASVDRAKSFGDLWIDSVVNVGAYWRGQKAFSAAARTTSGDTTTYRWTLPAHFPPRKFLRVTVDGGTLEQGGRALDWKDQGYYEVALDPGALTVSP